MTGLIYALYVISVPFLAIALIYLFRAKSSEERLLGMAVFGNSFSLPFWIGVVLAIVNEIALLPKELMISAAALSGLFLLIFFYAVIYLFNAPKSSRYPN